MLNTYVHKNLVILAFTITYDTNLSMIPDKINYQHTCLDWKTINTKCHKYENMFDIVKLHKPKILRLSLQSTPLCVWTENTTGFHYVFWEKTQTQSWFPCVFFYETRCLFRHTMKSQFCRGILNIQKLCNIIVTSLYICLQQNHDFVTHFSEIKSYRITIPLIANYQKNIPD